MKKNSVSLLIVLLALSSCGLSPTSSLEESHSSTKQEDSSFSSHSSSESSPIESLDSLSSNESSSLEELEKGKYVYSILKNSEVQSLGSSLSTRLGVPTLKILEDKLNEEEGNAVLSPASYILAIAGLSAVSTSFPNEAFGLLDDASSDVRSLLEAWNYEYHYRQEVYGQANEDYSSFEAVIAHQSVGPTYQFDPDKRQAIVSDHIATIESSLSSYHQDAERLFKEGLGYSIPVPDPEFTVDGVITYGGFKMKDFVPGGLGEIKQLFNSVSVPSYTFGSIYYPKQLRYYEASDYEVFRLPINRTSLVIVLPKVGVSLSSLRLSSAYEAFLKDNKKVDAMGYLPYFHVQNENLDLTSSLANQLSGKEVFYDLLMKEEAPRNLALQCILQSNDFEFNQYGVSGESITMIGTAGSAMPVEHRVVNLNVDRPFYAIAEKDNFPLFANKVMQIER